MYETINNYDCLMTDSTRSFHVTTLIIGIMSNIRSSGQVLPDVFAENAVTPTESDLKALQRSDLDILFGPLDPGHKQLKAQPSAEKSNDCTIEVEAVEAHGCSSLR